MVSGIVLALGVLFAYPPLLAWYHFRAARSAAERGDLAAEHEHLLKCLKGWKSSPDVYLRAARAARRLGHFDEATRCLRQSERLKANAADVALERLLIELERPDSYMGPRVALDLLRNTPQDRPALPEALEALSKSCLKNYQLEDARTALTLWIERVPDNVKPLLWRGWVLE